MSNESKRSRIREDINRILRENPFKMDLLLQMMMEAGYEVKMGRYQRISDVSPVMSGAAQDMQIDLLIDIRKKLDEGKGRGYEYWARSFNNKQQTKILLFLQDNDIHSLEELSDRTDTVVERFDTLAQSVKEKEHRLKEIAETKKMVIDYSKTRDIYDAYLRSGYSRGFFEEHREEIEKHKAAKRLFDRFPRGNIPKIRDLNVQYADILAEVKDERRELKAARDDMKLYVNARKDVRMIPGRDCSDTCCRHNEIRFSVNGENFHFCVETLPVTAASYVVENYRAELISARYSHVSESIFVTVRKYESDEYEYLLTHVIIEDPSQIRSALSNDTYGGERERPSDASKRLGWVVGVNGSNFSWQTNRPVYAGVCIKNRKIMEGDSTNGMEIFLKEDGTLLSSEEGISGEELLIQGVTDTWSYGDTLLIKDNEAVNAGIQSNQYRYPRTAIGMVEPGEYYLVMAGFGHYIGGMTYDEVRDVLLAHGYIWKMYGWRRVQYTCV